MMNARSHKHVYKGNARILVHMSNVALKPFALLAIILLGASVLQDTRVVLILSVGHMSV